MSSEIATYEHRGSVTLSIEETMDSLNKIRQLIGKAMVDDVDYGVIPGTNGKKVLLLPGAQKVAMYFNCFPQYEIKSVEIGGGHVEYVVTCKLISRASGQQVAEGLGSCSTMEAKYRWRQAERKCPKCGKGSIIKGKAEYGGGWLCWAKKGGCNAKFNDGDAAIESQSDERVENQDIYDLRNTILKMSKKRADVSAAISLGCMSELFTQDMESSDHGTDHSAAPEAHHGHDEPPVANTAKPSTDTPPCPICNGPCWDNRENKRNPKAPDFKCRDKGCQGLYWKASDVPAQTAPEPSVGDELTDRFNDSSEPPNPYHKFAQSVCEAIGETQSLDDLQGSFHWVRQMEDAATSNGIDTSHVEAFRSEVISAWGFRFCSLAGGLEEIKALRNHLNDPKVSCLMTQGHKGGLRDEIKRRELVLIKRQPQPA